METETTFVAPEGVYTVTEEHKPALFQPHTLSGNAPQVSAKTSSLVVRFPVKQAGNAATAFGGLLAGGNKATDRKKEKEREKEKENKDHDGVSLSSSDTQDELDRDDTAPTNNPDTAPPATMLFSGLGSGVPGKKKPTSRPKHNIKTTSSTFITRTVISEAVMKAKQGDVTLLFYNSGKSFTWVDAGSNARDPLGRVTFSAYPTCHSVNATTSSAEHLDIILGFHTGDLIWLDPISARYGRLNKQGCITPSPCTAVRWVPGSTNLFIVAHADGSIVVYDKERGDGVFTPDVVPADWNPHDNIFVTMPPWHPASTTVTDAGGKNDAKTVKNPVSHWRVSKKAIVDFVFSPDVKYVGAISEDGCLRVIDALAEQLLDCYASYFGALTCIAWSPDGRFILTGGQDDLLTIFSPWEQRVIARCQGHSSFVSSVAFDELRCDGRTYRFGSVGEDNKLILWDFSSGALHRPKFQATHQQRISMSSTLSLAFRREKSVVYLPMVNTPGVERYHPAPSRNDIAVVQPVLIKQLDSELPTSLVFLQRYLLTATKTGHLKLWIRPLALKHRTNRPLGSVD